MEIRNEEAQDIEQIRDIVRAAFPTDAESRLVDALRANGKAIISLVAVDNGQGLGHILFSPVSTSPLTKATGLGLAPVAVRSSLQSQGIGSQLIREGLRRGRELEFDFCVVLGSPEYYSRFGFEKASNFDLQNEYGLDDEFMVINFSTHPLPRGLVRYSSEFAMFSV